MWHAVEVIAVVLGTISNQVDLKQQKVDTAPFKSAFKTKMDGYIVITGISWRSVEYLTNLLRDEHNKSVASLNSTSSCLIIFLSCHHVTLHLSEIKAVRYEL